MVFQGLLGPIPVIVGQFLAHSYVSLRQERQSRFAVHQDGLGNEIAAAGMVDQPAQLSRLCRRVDTAKKNNT